MKLIIFKDDERGIQEAVNIVMALVVMVVAGAIGIFIADTVEDTANLGNPNMLNASDEVNRTTNANLSSMHTNILGAAQTGSSFVVILIIAFIGAIALGYIFLMQRRG